MQTLKINFGYFWPSFKNEDNYFTRILSQKYKIGCKGSHSKVKNFLVLFMELIKASERKYYL